MNRSEVLYKLLRLGPLTRGQLRVITGWPARRVDRTLEVATGKFGKVYALETPDGLLFCAKRDYELELLRLNPPKKKQRADTGWARGTWKPHARKHSHSRH